MQRTRVAVRSHQAPLYSIAVTVYTERITINYTELQNSSTIVHNTRHKTPEINNYSTLIIEYSSGIQQLTAEDDIGLHTIKVDRYKEQPRFVPDVRKTTFLIYFSKRHEFYRQQTRTVRTHVMRSDDKT